MPRINVNSSNLGNIVVGDLRAKHSAAGDRILRYYIDFRHNELDLHKELSAPEISILQNKVDVLMASWDKKWATHQDRLDVAAGHELAEEATAAAETELASLGQILAHTLSVDDAVDWESLKDHSTFEVQPFLEKKPIYREGQQPSLTYPKIGFIDWLLRRKAELYREAELSHESDLESWKDSVAKGKAHHSQALRQWEARREDHLRDQAIQEAAFNERRGLANNKVENLKLAWETGDVEAVIEHASMVLENSDYGELFEKSFEIEFDPGERLLLVEYELPSPDKMPTLKSVRFVPSTGELKETNISAREQKANFDLACFQICLRTLHELFEADTKCHIQKILLNGFSTCIDKGTGRDVRAPIMSILVSRDQFLAIDLTRIDPKVCFKSLKGVSAASLASLAPIAPIMELNKSDRRFVEGRSAANDIDEATNLAEMDWEEFEHLVREVFEKEFGLRGGEVKVTQSSRDGGVDAVAFDPDPISGGKIIIQAKRYTKTVGVSAVRDLYGTTLNEGATKGILVTTADYGPDAYKFASDKPLFLMTGANLLHMLAKHGIKAKIDIRAAREAMALRS